MLIWILRIFHILSGAAWAGYALFAGFILIPSIFAAGPSGGAVMGELMKRKLPVIISAVAGINLLTGCWLYGIFYNPEWAHTSTGLLLSLGGFLGIIVFIFGFVVVKPLTLRLAALGPGADPAERADLSGRLAGAFKMSATMVTLALLCMAASRYAPQLF
jgi:hypothetical protein